MSGSFGSFVHTQARIAARAIIATSIRPSPPLDALGPSLCMPLRSPSGMRLRGKPIVRGKRNLITQLLADPPSLVGRIGLEVFFT